jgi:predicted amidohydrolase
MLSGTSTTVGAYQMPVGACYSADAVEHLSARVRECERAGVSLLCCPEAALGGLADYVDAPDTIAVPADAASIAARLRPLTSRTVTVIVGFTERDDSGSYYNAAAVCSGGSVLGIYRKRNPAIRRSRYRAGSEAPVFCVNGDILGILICRDSTDAQLTARLVDQGAQMLCIPTNNAMPPDRSGTQLVDEVRRLDLRLATTLGVPVIRADVVGASGALVAAGTSMITQPSGVQLYAQGSEEGELVVAQLSLRGGTRHSVGTAVRAM